MVEIKSIELAPFTLITSSVHAVLAFILAIITLIVFGIAGAVIPQVGGAIVAAGVAAIIVFPISYFFITIVISFFSALLYNILVPRLGGVKLELEGSDVTSIPVVPFALILSAVGAIWAFIVGLLLAASSAPFFAFLSSSPDIINQAINNATAAANATTTAIPTPEAFAGAGIFVALTLIIGLPIVVFIVGFIVNALTAIFYNYIAVRVAKLQLEFENVSDTLHELKSIPIVPAALSIAIIQLVFGIISGLIGLIGATDAVAGLIGLIFSIIGNFIITFIVVAIAAWIYNFLVPRIGGIKVDLE